MRCLSFRMWRLLNRFSGQDQRSHCQNCVWPHSSRTQKHFIQWHSTVAANNFNCKLGSERYQPLSEEEA
eukprot:scaffold3731_cov156-Amphora_coffeaeformis.AAC.2